MTWTALERLKIIYRASLFNEFDGDIKEHIIDQMTLREIHSFLSIRTRKELGMTDEEAKSIWEYYGNKYFPENETPIQTSEEFAIACSIQNELLNTVITDTIEVIFDNMYEIHEIYKSSDYLERLQSSMVEYKRLKEKFEEYSDTPLIFLVDHKHQLEELVKNECNFVWNHLIDNLIMLYDDNIVYSVYKFVDMFRENTNLSVEIRDDDKLVYKNIKTRILLEYPENNHGFISSINDLLTESESKLIISNMFLTSEWIDDTTISYSENIEIDGRDADTKLLNEFDAPWLDVIGKLFIKYLTSRTQEERDDTPDTYFILGDSEDEKQTRLETFREKGNFKLEYVNQELCTIHFWEDVFTRKEDDVNFPKLYLEEEVDDNGNIVDFNVSIREETITIWNDEN